MVQLMREGCSYTYPPLSLARYSFIPLSELGQCRMKQLAQDFNTAAQGSNPGSRSRKSVALPVSHCDGHEKMVHDGMMTDYDNGLYTVNFGNTERRRPLLVQYTQTTHPCKQRQQKAKQNVYNGFIHAFTSNPILRSQLILPMIVTKVHTLY